MKGQVAVIFTAVIVFLVAVVVGASALFVSYQGVGVWNVFTGFGESSLSRHVEYVSINERPFLLANILLSTNTKEMVNIYESSLSDNFTGLKLRSDESNIPITEEMLKGYNRFYRVDLVDGETNKETTIARSGTEDFCGLNGVCEDSCSDYRVEEPAWEGDCERNIVQESEDTTSTTVENLGVCCVDEDKENLNEDEKCGGKNEGVCEESCSFMRSEISGECPSGKKCCKTLQREEQLTVVRTAEVPILFMNMVDYSRVVTGE